MILINVLIVQLHTAMMKQNFLKLNVTNLLTINSHMRKKLEPAINLLTVATLLGTFFGGVKNFVTFSKFFSYDLF